MKKLIHGIDVTRFLHSRYWVIVTLTAIIAVAIKGDSRGIPFDTISSGIFGLTPVDEWISSAGSRLVLGLLATVSVGGVLYLINTTFNLLRSISLIYLTVFFTIVGTQPALTSQFDGGQMFALLTFGALYPLFSAYQSPVRTREVFLSLCMLTTALILCCQITAWITMLAVFLSGIAQMRILRPQTIIAAAIGIITPIWILWGFGIINNVDISVPTLFSMSGLPAWISSGTVAYLTIIFLMWLTMSIFNLVRIYNYNARLRAYNGLFSLLGIALLLTIAFDPGHITTYLPAFAGCVAMQAGHFFTILHGSRSWIGILTVCLPFWIILLCDIYL
ncbi:MAG: hypothetical protein K2M98_04410 [Muribaculum sp.]|nr:hypothetical protein [Muribaculum sp.]